MVTQARTDRPANVMDTEALRRTDDYAPAAAGQPSDGQMAARAAGDETKQSFKTTEFWIYLAAIAAILIASQAVGTNVNHSDYFRADKAWFFITLLTLGYLGSRGLAKAGTANRKAMRDNRRR